MNIELILKDIPDMWSRENFVRLGNFINEQDLFTGDFKLFNVEISSKQTKFKIKHGLTFTPEDIISLSSEGDQNFYFRFQEFDSQFLYVTTNGPCKIRFLAGKLRNPVTGLGRAKPLSFVAPGDVIRPGTPGFVYGAVDIKSAGFWLTGEGIPSNVVGVPVLFEDASVIQVAVGTEIEADYTVGVFQHDGNGVGLTQIGSFSVTTGGAKRFSVNFPITTTQNTQLAVQLLTGSTKNLKVSLIVNGSAI